ncbi:MAG TPA: 50S ribosomal protein L11 methyltransferase [Kiritimatiellia bacterium]|nr:50S ribosomal protein L11 methyltransferase [Kiritimatiellia bacterium]HNS80174.1 50S ribosomal protein L11 methyltransferase [Kiritimatiellia bacterium]HPA77382.1 50S ribosomal protein L11 methyltransferase [Kiritimatiellia bacterium]HQQ03870.1 50S ribosomal protein L11 methyltransferase [Kiritimatiellia bacterium]
MKQNADHAWHVLTVELPEEHAEALQEWIRDRYGLEPVLLERAGARGQWIETYFPDASAAREAAVETAEAFPVRATAVRLLEARDWQNFWRHHFIRREIGRSLLIVPDWEQNGDTGGRAVIRLEPGLSFGTGDNFTTRFCLEMIDELFAKRVPESFLDVGAGSGILSIAAAKLGCPRIMALENDALSVASARENLERNGVTSLVTIEAHDILSGWDGGRYEFICANIISGVLTRAAPVLAQTASRLLVLSGILEWECDGVAEIYQRLGGREVIRDGDGQWCGLVFEFN